MSSWFPTTVESFINYLNGNNIDEYGDDGIAVIDQLVNIIIEQVKLELTQNMSCFHWQSTVPINARRLRGFFMNIWLLFDETLPEMNVRPSIIDAFAAWNAKFEEDYFTKVFVDFEPELQNIVKSIESLKSLYRDSQGDYSQYQSSFDKVINSVREYFYKHLESMNEQEKQQLDSRAHWLAAWKQPFRGTALSSLETKLALNVKALTKREARNAKMSRIISIVQSSGSGKSRLGEEY
jgi:hypothetical protein